MWKGALNLLHMRLSICVLYAECNRFFFSFWMASVAGCAMCVYLNWKPLPMPKMKYRDSVFELVLTMRRNRQLRFGRRSDAMAILVRTVIVYCAWR